MGWSTVCKLLQKQTHDFLSQKHGTIILVCGCILIVVSAFQFGEVVMEWSTEKYAAVFNSYNDNLAGRSFRNRLCLPVPIDVVYTWVNGTDPQLLTELRRQKMLMEQELNETRTLTPSDTCTFAHCVPAHMVIIEPPIPSDITLVRLGMLYTPFKGASLMYNQVNPGRSDANVSVVVFDSQQQVEAALNTTVVIDGKTAKMLPGYFTSDWTLPNAVILHDKILMTGFPHTMSEEELLSKIPSKYQKSITKFELFADQGVAVITLPVSEEFDEILKESNITIENKEPTLTSANLVWDLTDYSLSEDVSASRFEDNEELRYSLRSVERYAPWIRHVFIVTNGQIPGWLNMDSPRLTIVSHQEIYPNKSHLPTFSSPSIESHLHRIPGLSDKFIYLNDDVMFGKEVWPDDFFTHSGGQKIYLTWPVPNCQEGCPSSWIRDGYCDKACNNSECEWDGGDCKGGAGAGHQIGGGFGFQDQPNEQLYCNTGCANSWIADRYCDTACNVYPCGFDAGDCGTKSYSRLHGQSLSRENIHYTIPQGEAMFYFNISGLLGDHWSIDSATYNQSDIVRTVAVALKFKVITVVLYGNKSGELLGFSLSLKHNTTESQYNFTVSVDTRPVVEEPAHESKPDMVNGSKTSANQSEEIFHFDDIPDKLRLPQADSVLLDPGAIDVEVNMSLYQLPDSIQAEWQQVVAAFSQGELTEKGFRNKRGLLWNNYITLLKSQGLEPIKLNFTDSHINGSIIRRSEVEQGQDVGDRGVKENVPKDENSMKEYFHNVSSKLKNNLVQNEAAVVDEGAAMENVMPVKPLERDSHEQNQPQPNPFVVQNNAENQKKDELQDKVEEGEKFRSRHLNSLNGGDNEDYGFLPWEKQHLFSPMQKKLEAKIVKESYEVAPVQGRRLLDTFGDSLRHVNKIYNKEFGYVARKVPAHMPHMIDKNIMAELQAKFPKEWDVTSSHKARSSDDMQFAFAYYYYVMSEPKALYVRDVFNEIDLDKSGVLSDREIRTLATRLYEPPLDLQKLTGLENMLTNCSEHAPMELRIFPLKQEKYYEQKMPQVTLHLIEHCQPLIDLFGRTFKQRTKYSHEVVGEEEVAFKMIRSNVSQVVGQLDDIRRNPKKFVCLNDNIDHSKDDAKTVKAVLVDFYESLYPVPSSFELPKEYRNRFLHMDELREWRKYRDWLKLWTQVALMFLILFTVASFFSDKIESLQRRYFGRRRTSDPQSPIPQKSRIFSV